MSYNNFENVSGFTLNLYEYFWEKDFKVNTNL